MQKMKMDGTSATILRMFKDDDV